jgi:hypothetical protein
VQIMSDFYEAARNSGNAPEALAEVERKWLLKLRTGKGLAQPVNLAGPFIMSSQGNLKQAKRAAPPAFYFILHLLYDVMDIHLRAAVFRDCE